MLWPEGEGNEGKVMGLAPFGDPTAMGLPALEVRGHEVFIPEEWLKVFADRETYRWTAIRRPASFQACADLAAAGQQVWEDALMQLVGWLHEQTGLDNLVFAGGCGLELHGERHDPARVARSAACSSRRARTTAAPPSAARSTGWWSASASRATSAGSTTSSGPSSTPRRSRPPSRSLGDDVDVQRPADLAAPMVDLLERGRVVALHQGRSESGPRALGNRSIIGDPRRPAMQDYINYDVKGREWFRPLAPLVLADHAAAHLRRRPPGAVHAVRGRRPAGVPRAVPGHHARRRHRPAADRRAREHAVPARAHDALVRADRARPC